MCKEKNVGKMLEVVSGNIVDLQAWGEDKIDTIVNAARPSLMGGDDGVDGAIHAAIDERLGGKSLFDNKICEELKKGNVDNTIRCERGGVVTTSGFGFCNYVIHAVGSIYDGDIQNGKSCTSSCIKTLENCYYAIVEEIKKHFDIEVVGIPIIGAGVYRFPFRLAVEIAIATVGNALVQWKNQDEEMFEMAGIRKIKFFVYDLDLKKQEESLKYAQKVLSEFCEFFKENKRVSCHSSLQSSARYWQEVVQNDGKRGYFSVAKNIRLALLVFRFLFFPLLWLKDICAGKDWEKRRKIVEILSFAKVFVPIGFWFLLRHTCIHKYIGCIEEIFIAIVLYSMLDTITYLIMLILMADIQNSSANIIRSIILLFVNYVQTACDMAFLYFCLYGKNVLFRQALAVGFLGNNIMNEMGALIDYVFESLNTGIKFFFVTLVFGYFWSHMKQRKFNS